MTNDIFSFMITELNKREKVNIIPNNEETLKYLGCEFLVEIIPLFQKYGNKGYNIHPKITQYFKYCTYHWSLWLKYGPCII